MVCQHHHVGPKVQLQVLHILCAIHLIPCAVLMQIHSVSCLCINLN